MSDSKLENVSKSIKPVLGISECLMGKEVRFNGGHKRSRYCTDVLSEYFEFKPLCPEVAIGMTIPRKPIRLAHVGDDVRVIATDNPELDYTDALTELATETAPQLKGLSGYIFMQKSPSCAVGSSKIYNAKGHPVESGNGAFSNQLIQHLPLMPVTEAGKLNDDPIRENFIALVYAYHEWQITVGDKPTISSVANFHYRHKLSLIAHSEVTAKVLGQLIANQKNRDINELATEYIELFMGVMKGTVSRKRHANVLVKLHHYLKKQMNDGERKEILSLIQHYRNGIVPLVVPMTLIKFFMGKYRDDLSISLLEPYPMELGLQNGI